MKKIFIVLLALLVIYGTPVSIECQSNNGKKKIAVMDFELKVPRVRREFGTGLSDMLTNALVETNKFRVFERSRIKDVMKEQSLGLRGAVDPSTAASVGKMVGVDFLVMGALTEFSEVESSGSGVAILESVVGEIDMYESHIGLIIRIVHSTTGEIVASKSVDKKVSSVGLAGGAGIFGGGVGGQYYKSQAMQDAVEEAINDAVQLIKNNLESFTDDYADSKGATSTDVSCSSLSSFNAPKFMVVIPERNHGQINQPASETEIIKKFLGKGFQIVDQNQLEEIRYKEKVMNAAKNSEAAAALGVEFGADIIVIGEAISQNAGYKNGMVSARGRIDVKVVETSTGKIIAVSGASASGLDAANSIAGKLALQNAASILADDLIVQLCQKYEQAQYQSSGIEILLVDISFRQMMKFNGFLKSLPGIKNVNKKLTGNIARFQVEGSRSSDELAEAIVTQNQTQLLLEVKSLTQNKIELNVLGEGKGSGAKLMSEEEIIKQVQAKLNSLGYDAGSSNGICGDKTVEAIKEFQNDVGIETTGKPSLELLNYIKLQLQ